MRILGWRRIEEGDLAACFKVQPAAFGDEYTSRDGALSAWNVLLASPAFDGVVVEADTGFVRSQIVGFGAAVFVGSDFIDAELRDPRPYLTARVIASVAAKQSVVLSEARMGLCNREGGVDMVVLASRWTQGLTPQDVRGVQVQLEMAFLKRFLGYNFRRLLAEVTDSELVEYVQKSGAWRIVQQFRGMEKPHPGAADEVRVLFMTDREAALSMPMSAAAPLFQATPPVLGLRPTDQELLLAAMKGATDRELALELGLTEEAVKRRWAVLFSRVEKSKPELFSVLALQKGTRISAAGRRGPQKRHRVLAYVWDHPEELRPFKS